VSWALFALDVQEPVFATVRGAAAVVGAVLGWLAAGPACRLLVRAAFRKPAPGTLVLLARSAGAAGLACLIFYFLPLGFGGGTGWGVGPGSAGTPGQAGSGTPGSSTKNGEQTAADEKAPAVKREPLDIELIGGDRYKGDGKFYLLDRKQPPVTLGEVKKLFESNKGRLDVRIIVTRESVGDSHPAFQQLRSAADRYGIPTRKIER
jgi:hypothetical protein